MERRNLSRLDVVAAHVGLGFFGTATVHVVECPQIEWIMIAVGPLLERRDADPGHRPRQLLRFTATRFHQIVAARLRQVNAHKLNRCPQSFNLKD